MSLARETCFTISCDGCGQLLDRDDEGAIHFASEQDAIDAATERDWITNGDILCSDCIDAAGCVLLGHRWSPWQSRIRESGVVLWRYCYACRNFDRGAGEPADGTRAHGPGDGDTPDGARAH